MLIVHGLRKYISVKHLKKLKNLFIMSQENIRGMRASYKERTDIFTEDKLSSKDPISVFRNWFDEVCASAEVLEPNAMCLATCTRDGYPSARYVLMKGFGKDGFKFFTNYRSRKGKEMSDNPNVAVVFYWDIFHRSVRIEGKVEKLSEAESENYFHSRGKSSQIGAAISHQSEPICSRAALSERESVIAEEYSTSESIPKPEDWGGYLIKPSVIEFWQGQTDRIHDRIRFRRPVKDEVVDGELLHEGENGWVYERLQP